MKKIISVIMVLLFSVMLTSSVTSIGLRAFEGCDALTEITFEGNAPTTIANSAFNGVTATAYYYKTKNWTEDDFQNYGGSITWKAAIDECRTLLIEDGYKLPERRTWWTTIASI